MKRRVNLFQAAMLRWRALHPYNAVHALQVTQALDAGRLRAAIRDHLQAQGLTGLDLDARGGRYEWAGGPADAPLRVVSGGDDAFAVLRGEIEHELNGAFAESGRGEPFRFFAVTSAGTFYLGLAYDHYVAGGDSIAILLRDIVAVYLGVATPVAVRPMRRYGPSYARLLGRQAVPMAKGLPTLVRIAAGCRRALRMRYAAPQDGYNGVVVAHIDAADRARLEERSDAWGVTTHDLLLATLLAALSPLTIVRRQAPKRNEIAVASIVNIRRDLGAAAEHALAPCLASFRIAHRVPDDIDLRDLASAVHAQTDAIKRSKGYLQTLLGLGIAGFEWGFMSQAQRQRYFPKHFPVCAGTTPLHVDALWRNGGGGDDPPDYLRVVSTGPLAPMILAFTMVGKVINAGIAFRTTVYTRDDIEGVAAAMLRSIRTL